MTAWLLLGLFAVAKESIAAGWLAGLSIIN
jgi:hypothetical protein